MTANNRYWLGLPGNMAQLFSVNAGTQVSYDRSIRSVTLLDGGRAGVAAPLTKRAWQFARDWLTLDEHAQLMNWYAGVFGPAPYRLVDPSERNVLGQDASTFGAASGNPGDVGSIGWVASTGQLGGGRTAGNNWPYASWAGMVVNSTLGLDTSINAPGPVPVAIDSDYSFTVPIAQTTTDATATVQAQLVSDNGITVSGSAVALPVNSPYAYTTVSVSAVRGAAAVFAGAKTVTPRIMLTAMSLNGSGQGPNLIFLPPQMSYDAVVRPWVPGFGVASVMFTDTVTATTPRTTWRSPAWNLAEV